MADLGSIYSATYSSNPVYELKIGGDSVMRRRADDWVNATHILKAAGFDKPARTRILEREVQKGVHEKVQGGYGKYQGTWIPLQDGRLLAERNNIYTKLAPIFEYVAGDRSPPPAPKHTSASSKPRAPRKSTNRAAAAPAEVFNVVQPQRSMGPPSLPHEQYEMGAGFDDNESIEQATIESSSMIADEDMLPMSQHGGRKRKRENETIIMTQTEQDHILYGDELLDYFLLKDDPRYTQPLHPPKPPPNFQVDRPIDSSGRTALHWAASMGDLEIVQDLIRRGADVQATTIHEETPLVRAILFTNNYEKRTFPALLDFLADSISYRDWYGATVFHHIAETTRGRRGKHKSAKYYCDVMVDKLFKTRSPEEIDLLMSCQDDNGDTAALVAARHGALRLVNTLITHCPRSANLLNKKGETVISISQLAHAAEHDDPPAPSSVIMANDPADGLGDNLMPSDHQSLAPPVHNAVTSQLLSKIGVVMSEANKKLAVTYRNSKLEQQDSKDVANPEALYEQLESDRQKIQSQVAALTAQEAILEAREIQFGRYEEVRTKYESLLEQAQHRRISSQLNNGVPIEAPKAEPSSLSQEELVERFTLARALVTAQRRRRIAVKDLAQQTADAGVSTKFDVHRKLVALATGLKEEELDPMAAELAETLEFDSMNGKGPSPEPESKRLPSQQDAATIPPQSGAPVMDA